MHRYSFLVLLLCYNALCISEKCVTYNFEENQKVNFTNTYGICRGFSSWYAGDYSSLAIDSPHIDSSIFIKPLRTLSCISSFKFSITSSGIFELNVYMEPDTPFTSDQITLLVFQSLPGATDATVGNAVLSPSIPNFVPGWQTMRVRIAGLGTHEGYITLFGMASESSTVLVDSFRYIAPNYDKDSCIIYPSDKPTTEKTTIKVSTEILTPTSRPSTITVPTIPATTTTEIPTTTPETTSIKEPSTITTTTIPVTSTPEIPTTIPTTPLTSTTEIPTTTPSKEPTITAIPDTSTTERATTRSTTAVTITTSTERPHRSLSILIIKIKKFFR